LYSLFLAIFQKLFDTEENRVDEMFFQVHLRASQLDAEFEMEGKAIDDL
jgi:hypothetical protein